MTESCRIVVIDGYEISLVTGTIAYGVVISSDAPIHDPGFIAALGKAQQWLPKYESFVMLTAYPNHIIQNPDMNEIINEYESALEFGEHFNCIDLRDVNSFNLVYAFIHPESDTAKRVHEQKAIRDAQPKPSRKGFVYLMQNPLGTYKIGLSKSPERRRRDLSLPDFELVILHTIPAIDMQKSERELHNRYADKRTEGEWFALTDDDVREICAIEEL